VDELVRIRSTEHAGKISNVPQYTDLKHTYWTKLHVPVSSQLIC